MISMEKAIELKNLLKRINKLLQSGIVPETKKQELMEDKKLIENMEKRIGQLNEKYDRKIRAIERTLKVNYNLTKEKIKKLTKERKREERQDKTRYIG
jgi:hypothetical protein